jgi:hypothetical protein
LVGTEGRAEARTEKEAHKFALPVGLREDSWVIESDRPRTKVGLCKTQREFDERRYAWVHGKTSDGSRLIELKLTDSEKPAFFAAASNVLQKDLDE